MKRRTLLAGAGSALSASVVGCVGQLDSGPENGDDGASNETGDDAVMPSTGTPIALGDDCGPADLPLSALLTERTGNPTNCSDGATPSLVVENEREEALTVAVDLADESGGEDADENGADEGVSETYEIDPSERIVEWSAFEAQADLTGTVRIDGEETRVEWPERSCYRHAIALASEGIEIGWIEPLSGPGDTQHDCYAGDDAMLRVYSKDEARTVAVTVTDRCTGAETTESFDVGPDGAAATTEVLTDGGVYDLEFSLGNGRTESYEFHAACRGVSFSVDEDREVQIRQIAID